MASRPIPRCNASACAGRRERASDNGPQPWRQHGQNERAMAPGRKSWLFCGFDRGGRRAAAMYSLIVTAKMNGVDPQAWLADVLSRIAGHPAHRLDELLPWTGDPRTSTRSPASGPSTESPKTSARTSTSSSTSPSKWSPRTASSGSRASPTKASWPSPTTASTLVELIKIHRKTKPREEC